MKKYILIFSLLFLVALSVNAQLVKLESASNKTIIKFKPASPAFYHLAGGIEQSINGKYSINLSFGSIGKVNRQYGNWIAEGYHISAGPRLYLNFNHFLNNANGAFYINPQVAFSKYSIDQSHYDGLDKHTEFQSTAFLINLGRQEIFLGIFALELSGGIGYGDRISGWENYQGYKVFYTSDHYFSHAFTSPKSTIVYHVDFSVGVNLGEKLQIKSVQSEEIKNLITNRPKNSYSFGIAGAQSILSFNYERLFLLRSGNFLSAQIGAGLFPCIWNCNPISASSHMTVNFGSTKHFLEIGPGLSVQNELVPYATFGYRYQPIRKRKMNFRIFTNVSMA